MFWDLSSLALGQLLSMLLGFFGFAYLARALPPDSYGLIEYAVVLAGLAGVVIEGGMGTVGTLAVSRDPARARELAGLVPGSRLLLALVVVPLIGLSGTLMRLDAQFPTLLWLFAISLLAIPFKQDWLLQGLEKMAYVAPAQVVKSGVFAVGVLILVNGVADLMTIGIVEIVAAFLGAAYYLGAQRAVSVPLTLDIRIATAWPLIRAGSSVGANNIVWAFMLYLPISVVATVAGTTEAAWIGGVQRIVAALVSFSALYFFNLYPLMARELITDRARWERLMGSSFRVIAWTSVGLAMMSTLMAEALVVLALGEPFLAAAPVFRLYIWLLPLRLLSGHARWTLLADERQHLLLLVEVFGAFVLLVSSLAFVPAYGALGAAAAVIVANILAWLAAHIVARRFVGRVPGIAEALPAIVAAFISLAVARYLGDKTALGFGASILTYVGCLTLTARNLLGDAVRLAHAKQSRAE
jgi:O-antigen/teichoic acid export membrane protein